MFTFREQQDKMDTIPYILGGYLLIFIFVGVLFFSTAQIRSTGICDTCGKLLPRKNSPWDDAFRPCLCKGTCSACGAKLSLSTFEDYYRACDRCRGRGLKRG